MEDLAPVSATSSCLIQIFGLWIQVVESVVEGQRYSIEALNFPSRAEVAFALSNGEDLKAPSQSLGTQIYSAALI